MAHATRPARRDRRLITGDKQAVASAVNDVSRELGGVLGIAVLGGIF